MSSDLRKINERLSLAMQSGRQVAVDWMIAEDRLVLRSELPECFSDVPFKEIDSTTSFINMVHEEDRARLLAEVVSAFKATGAEGDALNVVEMRLRDRRIGWRWVALYGKVVERDAQGRALMSVGVFADIMARRQGEQRILRLRDLYAALSQTSQAILHIRERQALFDEVCRIVVENARFQIAVIRLVDESTRLLRPAAAYGPGLANKPMVEVSVDPGRPEGRGPAGTSVRENASRICNDWLAGGFHQEWIDVALRVGFRSVGAFPIRQAGKPIGALILYSEHKDYFDRELIALLEEMSQQISFSLDYYEHEARRLATETALAQSESFKDAILLAALDCIVSFDAAGNIIDFNPAAERTFGYRREEVIGKPLAEQLIAPESRASFSAGIGDFLAQGKSDMLNRRIELIGRDAQGAVFPVEIAVAPINLQGRPVFTAYIRNITELKQSQAILRDSEARYRQVVDLSPEAIFVQQDGRFVLLNEACLRLLGAHAAEEVIGREVASFVHAPALEEVGAQIDGAPLELPRTGFVEELWRRLDGTLFHAEVAASRLTYMGAPAVQTVVRDISARKLAEQKQLAQNRILSMIALDEPLPAILSALAQFIETQSERAMCAIQLLNAGGATLQVPIAGSLPPDYSEAVADMPVGPGHCSFGTAVHRRAPVMTADIDSDPLWLLWRDRAREHGLRACSSWPIFGKQNKVLGAVSLYFGETGAPSAREAQLAGMAARLAGIAIENKESEERIRYLAHYDEMTALPNRFLFRQLLEQAIVAADDTRTSLAVLFVDLDRFKNINDTFGHGAGDQALREISARMRAALPGKDVLARMGGDEFYVLLPDVADAQQASSAAQKILDEASRPLYIHSQEWHLSASVGIALYPNDGADAATLLKHADIAMYRAKSDGKNAYRFYSASKDMASVERMAMESQLRRAIDHGEFVLHYQPKVELASGHIKGVEALVRWAHPEKGLLGPGEFIALAEETRLIVPLSKHILRAACEAARLINAGRASAIPVAVNLSARQLEEEDFLEGIRQCLAETGLDSGLLQLELTESMVMKNPRQATRMMKELQVMGVRLDLDDFGTGYSSLAYLKRFPLHSLKIDRSFIRDIPHGPNDTAITQAIIAMAHSLGMRVVAEGVERADQVEALRQFGCDEYQGFYFSRPLPLEQFLDLLDRRPALAASA